MKSIARIKNRARTARLQNKVVEMPAFLGDLTGTVKADDNGNVYVVLFSGEVRVVRNDVVPSIPRLPVIIGNDRNDGRMRVLRMRNAFSDPTYVDIPAHADRTHQWPQIDTLWVRPEQFLVGLAIPASGMTVQFVGFVYFIDGWHLLRNQTIDLTDYIPASGANYVLVQVDESKVLSFVEGTSKGSRELLEDADIPLPTAGNKPLFAVKMYFGQVQVVKTKLSTDIVDLRWAGYADFPTSIDGGNAATY